MENKTINRLKFNSGIIRDRDIKRIVQEQIDGYELSSNAKDYSFLRLINNKGSVIELTFGKDNVCLIKQKKSKYEITTIKNGPRIEKNICEKREKGILFKKLSVDYGYTVYSDKNKYPTHLKQDEYFINKDVLSFNGDFKKANLGRIFGKNIAWLNNFALQELASFKSSFETYMKYDIPFYELRNMNDTLYSTCTYIDGKDISHLYDVVNGPDKLFRILDLYNGIVNTRNICDIKSIHLGLLRKSAFGYRELCGIKDEERKILSDKLASESKIKKVSKLISSVTWYKDELKSLDRDILIDAIKYEPKTSGFIEENSEKTTDISYQEFSKLDAEEQNKVIIENACRKYKNFKDTYIGSHQSCKESTDDKARNLVDNKLNVFQKTMRKIKKNQ